EGGGRRQGPAPALKLTPGRSRRTILRTETHSGGDSRMKKIAAIVAVLALVSLQGALACDKDKDKTAQAAPAGGAGGKEVVLTGYLTDSKCGDAHSKSCPADCLKKGAKVQLHADAKVYTLVKLDAPETHFGYEVKVTGLLDESTSTIQVA